VPSCDRAPFTSGSHRQAAVFENCRNRLHAQIYQIRPPELISSRMLMAIQNGGSARVLVDLPCHSTCC
jgi:hypothetical protein